jgi:hypothetical protein
MKPPRFGKWTSAAIQMPGRQESVITLSSSGQVATGTGATVASDPEITFWMPLPTSPKELPAANSDASDDGA